MFWLGVQSLLYKLNTSQRSVVQGGPRSATQIAHLQVRPESRSHVGASGDKPQKGGHKLLEATAVSVTLIEGWCHMCRSKLIKLCTLNMHRVWGFFFAYQLYFNRAVKKTSF